MCECSARNSESKPRSSSAAPSTSGRMPSSVTNVEIPNFILQDYHRVDRGCTMESSHQPLNKGAVMNVQDVDFEEWYQGATPMGRKLPWDLGTPQPAVVA